MSWAGLSQKGENENANFFINLIVPDERSAEKTILLFVVGTAPEPFFLTQQSTAI